MHLPLSLTRLVGSLITCCSLVFVVGCSQNTVVKGTVKFEDGTPLTKGTIVFESATTRVSSPLTAKGEFTLGGVTVNDGVPPGTYKGWFIGTFADSASTSGGGAGRHAAPRAMPKQIPLIDQKYFEGATSGMTLEIAKGSGAIKRDIVVEKPSAGKK
ncbi:MAG: hypothetical protein ACRC46_15595 [Thermoguttaceae bacterium]